MPPRRTEPQPSPSDVPSSDLPEGLEGQNDTERYAAQIGHSRAAPTLRTMRVCRLHRPVPKNAVPARTQQPDLADRSSYPSALLIRPEAGAE